MSSTTGGIPGSRCRNRRGTCAAATRGSVGAEVEEDDDEDGPRDPGSEGDGAWLSPDDGERWAVQPGSTSRRATRAHSSATML
ncbi:hypothetical protein GCM10027601_00110 [Nocardioides ungokensis]